MCIYIFIPSELLRLYRYLPKKRRFAFTVDVCWSANDAFNLISHGNPGGVFVKPGLKSWDSDVESASPFGSKERGPGLLSLKRLAEYPPRSRHLERAIHSGLLPGMSDKKPDRLWVCIGREEIGVSDLSQLQHHAGWVLLVFGEAPPARRGRWARSVASKVREGK